MNLGYYYRRFRDHMETAELRNSKKLDLILERLQHMSIELDNLTTQVRANSVAVDAAVLLINGIADRITAAGVDPAKLQALTDELKSKDEALATAVVANTPSA